MLRTLNNGRSLPSNRVAIVQPQAGKSPPLITTVGVCGKQSRSDCGANSYGKREAVVQLPAAWGADSACGIPPSWRPCTGSGSSPAGLSLEFRRKRIALAYSETPGKCVQAPRQRQEFAVSNRVAIAAQTPMASASRLPRNDGRQPAACKTRKPPHKSMYKCHFFAKNFQKFKQNAICRLNSVCQ